MGLRDIGLKEEYRSDRDDIVAEFFFPCLSHCIEYDRCVDFLSIQSLATIAMAFDNFTSGKAKLRGKYKQNGRLNPCSNSSARQCQGWCPQGDLNPCYGIERQLTWPPEIGVFHIKYQ